MDYFDVNTPETVEEFLATYNQNIESLILYSNMGFAAEIDQEGSALEKHEIQQKNNTAPGV